MNGARICKLVSNTLMARGGVVVMCNRLAIDLDRSPHGTRRARPVPPASPSAASRSSLPALSLSLQLSRALAINKEEFEQETPEPSPSFMSDARGAAKQLSVRFQTKDTATFVVT